MTHIPEKSKLRFRAQKWENAGMGLYVICVVFIPGGLFAYGGKDDYLQINVFFYFLRVISSHSRKSWKSTLGVSGELFLLFIVHCKWNTELRCKIMSCSAEVGVVWPVGEAGVYPVFGSFIWTDIDIHLHIVYGCHQAARAELSSCDRDILLSAPF